MSEENLDEKKEAIEEENNEEVVEKAAEAVGNLLDERQEKADEAAETVEKEEEKAEVDSKEDLEKDEPSKDEAKEETTPDGEKDSKKEVADEATKKIDEEVEKLNLTPRLLQAAKRNHLEPQEILDLGDKAELVLTRLAENSDRVSEQLGALGRKIKEAAVLNPEKKEAKKATLDLEVKDDDEDEVKLLKQAITTLNSQMTQMQTQIAKKSEESTSVLAQERDKKIDTFFDGKTGEFSEFGSTKTLTNAELIMRKNVWETADDIMVGAKVNGQSVSLEEALASAFSIYEAKSTKKKVSREKILDEVKEREKQHISRASSKKKPIAAEDKRKSEVNAVKAILDKSQAGW